MITAVDTDVLSDILLPNVRFYDASLRMLEDAANAGSLMICDLVYAELCVHFEQRQECDEFLKSAELRVEALNREAQFLASRAWREYRRRGGQRTRIMPDFLIGAHAQVQASRLLTRDRGFYRAMFPELEVLDPSEMKEPGSPTSSV